MSGKEQMEGSITAFPVESIQPQKQSKTGLDEDLEPHAIFDQLEDFDENGKPFLRPYKGSDKLKNKVALVTGGDSGIGRATVILYAHEGADSSIVYLPSERKDAETLKSKVESLGRRLHLIEADLLQEESWKRVVDEHMKAFQRLDVLVSNAARQHIYQNIEEIDLESVKQTFTLNNVAMIALTKYAVPHMKRGSKIIQSTSVASYSGNPTLVDYSATKGAIHTMTRALAKQLGPRGIRVNCVAPGIIYTPLQPATGNQQKESLDSLGKGKPPLERGAQPVEVATSYVFLASADSSFFTGTCLEPDGGQACGT